MPQIFQVLRCYKCLVFQVHQTKKSSKWECKLCGEKQSIKRHYGIGTGRECRLHVQKLNDIRGEIEEETNSIISDENSDNNDEEIKFDSSFIEPIKETKWMNYLDQSDPDNIESIDDESNSFMEGGKVVLEIPKKQRKTFCKDSYKCKKTMSNNLVTDCSKSIDNINTNYPDKTSTLKPQDDFLKDKDRDSFDMKRVANKFVPPVIKNKNLKWPQYENECKNDNMNENFKNSFQKTFKFINHTSEEERNGQIDSIHDTEQQDKIHNLQAKEYKKDKNKDNIENSYKESVNNVSVENAHLCMPETVKLTMITSKNNYSKWAKFTEDNYDSNYECPTHNIDNILTKTENRSQRYKVTNQVAPSNISSECFLDNNNDLNFIENDNIFNPDAKISYFTSLFDNNDLEALEM